MTRLPRGTVTFLFTDIEGSTKLLAERGPEAYAEALAVHRRALRKAFDAHAGVEVDTQGDAFFVAFPTAPGAIAAAAEAQEALADGPVTVRMGLHTGTPHLSEGGYVGVDVHRAARIAAVAHGGQVLVSTSAASLLDAVDLRDLGEHRLKDLTAPERIFQLGQRDFPSLKSLYRTNLPIASTAFVGRDLELGDVIELVSQEDVRLLTLSGPGGIGKTRLGLQAAAAAADRFPDGVYWVPLASLRDARLVLQTVADAIGAKEALALHIADKRLLVLVDNLEHVIDAADELAALVTTCPNLHLLVTSRELLRVPGEQVYAVQPLEPRDGEQLFLARARSVLPEFASSEAVAKVCERLEQLPLALELAAARVRVLSTEQLLERLGRRLDLLKAGRGADPRQQTLRATIEWSHDLLSGDEQRLFARLSVFQDGCRLDAIEAVCDGDLDTLQSLVDKSLVGVRNDDRFWMLVTISEFAAERLEETDEATALRADHCDYFLTFCEAVESGLAGGRQAELLARLADEHANLRAALAWALESDPASALRLAAALRLFWSMRGHMSEGRSWLDKALAYSEETGPTRAKALFGAALLATLQGDWQTAKRYSVECRDLSLTLGESKLAAESLLTLGRATLAEGDPVRAIALFHEASDAGTDMHDDRVLGMAKLNLGYLELAAADYEAARTEFDGARAGFQAADDLYGVARSLAGLGSVALHQDRTHDAVSVLEESLRLSRRLSDLDDIGWALELIGVALAELGDPRCAQLLGAAEALRERLGASLEGVELALHERGLAALPAMASATAFDWNAGRELSPEDAVALALHPSGREWGAQA